jgi:hypothetical protein
MFQSERMSLRDMPAGLNHVTAMPAPPSRIA